MRHWALSTVAIVACWTGNAHVEVISNETPAPAPVKRTKVRRACLADHADRVPTRPDMWTQCGSSWAWTPPDYWECVAGELEAHIDALGGWINSALLWCGP